VIEAASGMEPAQKCGDLRYGDRSMRRTYFAALTSFVLLTLGGVSLAGDFWERSKLDWHRNNMWPQPFIVADRISVCEPFAIQTNNGWRLQNTIGDAYFDPNNQELTVAGQTKVKWIVQQAPVSRRTVFVLVSEDQQATNARVSSVQQAVGRFTIKGPPAEVMLTDRDVTGGSGEYYDSVDRALKGSVPPPRLPARGGSGGGAAGGGSGSGGSAGAGS
jgi:hypothetical protein